MCHGPGTEQRCVQEALEHHHCTGHAGGSDWHDDAAHGSDWHDDGTHGSDWHDDGAHGSDWHDDGAHASDSHDDREPSPCDDICSTFDNECNANWDSTRAECSSETHCEPDC